MAKSCFDGYLTDECANCPDWKNGNEDGYGLGCYTKYPIMLCPYFKKMFEEERKSDEGDKSNG